MNGTQKRRKCWYTMGCHRAEWENFCSLSVDIRALNQIKSKCWNKKTGRASQGTEWVPTSQRAARWLTHNSCRWSDSRSLQKIKNYRVRSSLLLLFNPILCSPNKRVILWHKKMSLSQMPDLINFDHVSNDASFSVCNPKPVLFNFTRIIDTSSTRQQILPLRKSKQINKRQLINLFQVMRKALLEIALRSLLSASC